MIRWPGIFTKWSGRQDSNLRSPVSKTGGDDQTPLRLEMAFAVVGAGDVDRTRLAGLEAQCLTVEDASIEFTAPGAYHLSSRPRC